MKELLRLLIVEDSEDDALLLVHELKRGGYSLSWKVVDNYPDMEQTLDEDVWDLIIADYSMPGFSAMDALEALGKSGLDIPFIILSGTIGEEIAVEAMKAGAHDYIIKGNQQRLLPALERELREAHERQTKRLLEKQLHYQATHDDLTGLINRREIEHRLELALRNAKKENRKHAFCYLDLDQFKIVNDVCGHFAGDQLLKQITGLLQNKMRDTGLLGRLGGDELGLILEDRTLEEALEVAQFLCETVKDFRFTWDGRLFQIGVSIGLVAITPESGTSTDVLKAADSACFSAKDQGRNRVYVFQEDDSILIQRQREMEWVSYIKNIEADKLFLIYFQKIVPIQEEEDGEVWEILLRFQKDQQILGPAAAITAAEKYNLMDTIDKWVISTTLRYLSDSSFKESHNIKRIHLNLSGQSISVDGFQEFIVDNIKLYGVDPKILCFEITETAVISNTNKAIRLIEVLRELGCTLALDDFGSGLSSFGYLRNFNADYLKIDGSFVKDMDKNEIDSAIVEAINRIGHVMGLKTIAEFVERPEVNEILREMGVDYVQGFGMHKPEGIKIPSLPGD